MTKATCGHWLRDDEGEDGNGTMIAVKEHSRDGSRAVGYPVVCDKCLAYYKKKKAILTEEQANKWLFNEA